jgi:hypothetical protein
MVADHFGLHVREPSESEIDRGAAALRAHDMQGRITRSWDKLPKHDKEKWKLKATTVLRAALGN